MELDIKKAYLSPFSEEKWYLKLIFPSIMALISIILSNKNLHIPNLYVLIIILISIIPSFILSGFFIQFEHNEIHDELPLLPILKSNIPTYGKYGVNCIGVAIFYGILSLLLLIAFALAIKYAVTAKIFIGIILLIPFILFLIAAGLAQSTYADSFHFTEAINIKRVFIIMSKVKVEILVYLLMSIILTFLTFFITLILVLSVVGIILVPFTTAILQLIIVNIKAQVYKVAKYRLENHQQHE